MRSTLWEGVNIVVKVGFLQSAIATTMRYAYAQSKIKNISTDLPKNKKFSDLK